MAEKNSARRAYVVLVGNQKGGVGKTTNTLNLAAALVERGKRLLVIDLDMTGGLTKALGAPMSGWHSSYDLMTGAAPPLECVIHSGEDDEVPLPPGIDLIPASRQLAELDDWLRSAENKWVIQQDMLLKPITELREHYDLIIFDTPPQVTTTTLPAMKAADFVVLSAMPDYASTEQLGEALHDVEVCQRGPNPNLNLLGIVICAMPSPQTVLARQLNDYVRKRCVDANGDTYRFQTAISRTTVVQEARAKRMSVFQYNAAHKVADQFRALAKELEERIEKVALGASRERHPEPARSPHGDVDISGTAADAAVGEF